MASKNRTKKAAQAGEESGEHVDGSAQQGAEGQGNEEEPEEEEPQDVETEEEEEEYITITEKEILQGCQMNLPRPPNTSIKLFLASHFSGKNETNG